MQSRVAGLQVSLQQGSSDEKAIREEISRMNLRQVEIMDVVGMFRHLAMGRRNRMHTGMPFRCGKHSFCVLTF